MPSYYRIHGGNPLKGTVEISGAKNATLPMFCAALLTSEPCTFERVPAIADVETLLTIFETMGVQVERDIQNSCVTICAKDIDTQALTQCHLVKKLRASLLCMGPVLQRMKEVTLFPPGGCILGARPNYIHVDGLQTLGAEVLQDDHERIALTFKRDKISERRILLSEASVTGTENLAMFLAGQDETAEIYFAAAEPHVVATLKMLQQMGADIEGIGTHHLKITGRKQLKGGTFIIPPDGILVGTFALAGALTHGDILIKNVDHAELYSFYGVLKRIGVNFDMQENALRVHDCETFRALPKIQTAIFPGFSTDLQSPCGVLLTQCEGESIIFETLFENRLTYLTELEKMGAQIKILNPHQARITGVTPLRGAEVQSWDLRAGAAMVLAGLIAEGETKVTNVQYIDRGYEHFAEKLQTLGADITRTAE